MDIHRYRMALAGLLAMCLPGIAPGALAQEVPKYAAKIPPSITTPDTVQTRIGTLKFFDGAPDPDTVKLAYDQLDFGRGVETFMAGIPAASVYAICEGLDQVGVTRNKVIGITEDLMDARSLLLTPNSTTVYVLTCLDLNSGPVVLQVPPNVLGPADDAYFLWVTDLGLTGPDKGKGGKYLFVPPGYKGKLPSSGYHVVKPHTNGVLTFFRAFVQNGDIAATIRSVKANANIYPLSAAKSPPPAAFLNLSGKQFNTVHANDFHFYEELNAVVQSEPADFVGPETVGLFASIGIRKGEPFAPDARMKAILTDAVAVGNAAARSILYADRDPKTKFFPDRQWFSPFNVTNYEFMKGSELDRDARTQFHYYATGVTPAMTAPKVGSGSTYAISVRDAQGNYLDGSKTYKITLPGPVPAKQFWSFAVYDNQTRSLLETDQKLAGLDSNSKDLKANADGSYTVWFGPKAPAGQDGNWVQTWPGKGWNVLFRLYGPLQPWLDRTWKPGDFELIE